MTEQKVNGVNGTCSDDEEEKSQRPVDIEADVREMERRKRVEAIMHSKMFREELERVVGDSLREGGADGISALLSDVMNIKSGSPSAVIPINDIRGLDSLVYAKGEKQLRCKLAAVYRLIDLHGWTQGIYNHVTARISQDTEHFLLNPFGVLYNEVTASSLVKVNMQGETVEEGTTNFGVNKAGFVLHSAIHAARPDIKCIIHLHTPNIVAVSTMKCGLMPLCQEACLIGDVSYHSYRGLVVDEEEKISLAKDLGPNNKVMFLRNHGVVCCGRTIEEAWLITYHTVLAVDTQLKMMPYGMDNLVLIDEDTRARVYEQGMRGGGGVNISKKDWGVGELEFEALMRMLDNSGFRSGYVYIEPLVKKEPARQISDVELPPTVSNLGYLLEEEELYKDGPLQSLLAQMARASRSSNKTKWVNSPNVYQKVEVLETGTTDPKKITKWVSDGSPSHNNAIKIEKPNQFVPLNTNPREFKKVQKMMKEGRRIGGVHAGPESRVLEGVSWDEARQMQDAQPSNLGDNHYEMKVGAASKGIIQRDFQHHATVYKSPYAKVFD
ncbi:protein hu-li tai shao isoform X1 [Eurytemora carolleeae]|uniref:protein hu-li tai shao isoform X1 n=1 Tax=Eurytemora carolleeae TaxID=1294199 RepID=UPI000C77417A|nr:protein hu-li tai shao isoform X1 [Eurytemora carolleeae]|eukprot:XP_023339341.1 protein hu-li tai shao-like isoform X1 [Eurytemora affinis]